LRQAIGTLTPKKQTNETKKVQERLMRLCREYDAQKRPLEEFIRAVGHGIRFHCD